MDGFSGYRHCFLVSHYAIRSSVPTINGDDSNDIVLLIWPQTSAQVMPLVGFMSFAPQDLSFC